MTKKTTGRAGSTGSPPSEIPADHVFAESGDRPPRPENPLPERTAEAGAPAAAPPSNAAQEELSRQLADAESRALRAQADLDNFRKRIRREMDEERRYAALPLIRDLLPAIDNLGRAMGSMGDGPQAADYRAGIEMVSQQFLQILAQHHCHPIDPLNETFDPMWHEAIGREQNPDVPPGTVLRVEQTGFRLHDRVVRPAYVVVSATG